MILANSNTIYGARATQSCDVGFNRVGSNPDIVCLEAGWTSNTTGITCVIVGKDYIYGLRVQYTCMTWAFIFLLIRVNVL